MTYTAAETETPLDPAFENDLLAIADTKLVLGNWYAECVMNGRSLPDFAGLLGMSASNYGHTRALYQYLAAHGRDYAKLERGRSAAEIRSMNLLDAAPEGWEDFLAATWLAEQATWMLMSSYLDHPDRAVAGLAKKIGQETYFHLKYVHGWLRIIGQAKKETAAFQDAFAKRYPLALQWFGPGTDNPTRDAFVREVAAGEKHLGAALQRVDTVSFGNAWRAGARRAGPLPKGLYEVVRFKDPQLAH
jgi:1,2-phenylacetyl-CoA epoxidase catalytic subunit